MGRTQILASTMKRKGFVFSTWCTTAFPRGVDPLQRRHGRNQGSRPGQATLWRLARSGSVFSECMAQFFVHVWHGGKTMLVSVPALCVLGYVWACHLASLERGRGEADRACAVPAAHRALPLWPGC